MRRIDYERGNTDKEQPLSLRKKIADSAWLNNSVQGAFAAHIRFAHRTSKWERHGFEPMDAALSAGEPVIMVLWHQRLLMAPFLFSRELGPFCSLTSSGRAGGWLGKSCTGSAWIRWRCPHMHATCR